MIVGALIGGLVGLFFLCLTFWFDNRAVRAREVDLLNRLAARNLGEYQAFNQPQEVIPARYVLRDATGLIEIDDEPDDRVT